MLPLFPHLCILRTMIFMIESLSFCHHHIASGNSHYITWLVYSNDRLPQNCLRSSWASKLDAHPLVFFKSFHILLALVHQLYGNPYSFTLIYIDEHLHSSLICIVNVTIFSLFALQPPPHSVPLIVLKPWLTLMYCVRVEKVWESKGVKQLLGQYRGCAWFKFVVQWW